MPELILAEKPSVARDLARVLGVKQRGQGFLFNKEYVITWCIGHLVELCEPHEYDHAWKRWSLDSLPILPRQFQLRPAERTLDHYDAVQRLMQRSDLTGVINACDAGREGELIFRYVYNLTHCNLPVRRLWISSMTDEAIQEGFSRLRPGEEFDNLYNAARCRSEADWLVGINSTRAMTVRTRQLAPHADNPLLSVGRVQTPTLAMMVNREREILDFTPEDYWQIKGFFKAEKGDYTGRWFKKKEDRFTKEEDAIALVESLQDKPAVIKKVEQKQSKEKPPFLFDLTHLQRQANKRYGFSAARVLELAQSLYEKHKLLTYPRTDSRFLSSDMHKKMKQMFGAVSVGDYEPFAKQLLDKGRVSKSKRVFNDAKVSDHHAIVPTTKTPNFNALNNEERKIYDLVVRRFLAAFFPDAIISRSKIITGIEKETFVSKGKVVLDPGWQAVEPPAAQRRKASKKGGENKKSDDKLLPAVEKGEEIGVEKLEIEQKKTKAPPRYTEATLLAAMEGAGRFVEEEELQQALKDSGIGTPATRANIIETLLSRGYIQRQGKTLHPEPKGMRLVENMPVESLSSPQLTGEWEARLSKTARGEYSVDTFEDEVRVFVRDIVEKISNSTTLTVPTEGVAAETTSRFELKKGAPDVDKAAGYCPACGGAVVEKDKVFGCSGEDGKSRGCSFRIYKTVAKKKLTPTMVRKLLEKGKTNLLKGFTSRQDKKFDAILVLNPGGRVTFEFENNRDQKRPQRPQRPQEPQGELRFESSNNMHSATTVETPKHSRSHGTSYGQSSMSDIKPALGTPLAPCPRCREGQMIRGRQAWGCNRWKQGCNVVIPYVLMQRPFSESEALILLEKRQTSHLAGFVNDSGEKFEGVVRLVDAQNALKVEVRAEEDF
jgi:DNA topoisomerase-3